MPKSSDTSSKSQPSPAVKADERSFDQMLARLYHYVNDVLKEDEFGPAAPQIAWDWEMVYEAIYPEKANSVYSGLLWYGLDCMESWSKKTKLGNEEWRVILPEGARQEMLVHLKKLLTRRQHGVRQLHILEVQSKVGLGLSLLEKRGDWKDVLEYIRKLIHLDESINRIIVLLKRYVRPAPFDSAEIPKESFNEYNRQMKRMRKHSGRSNAADAYNLATVDRLTTSSELGRASCKAYLITATKTVAAVAPLRVHDPFYFVFQAQVRNEHPEREDRVNALMAIAASILRHRLARRQGYVEALPSPLTRTNTKSFIHELDLLHDDPALFELGQMMSNAWQAVERSTELAQEISDDLAIPPRDYDYAFRGFKRCASELSLIALN